MRLSIAIACLALVGCTPPPRQNRIDQCMREQLFAKCLAAVPAGPVNTQYNDWAEVIEECDDVAREQSFRAPEFVVPACRMSQ